MTRGLLEEDDVRRITRTMPLRKVATPEDVAAQVVVLASERLSGHVTGELVTVAGGMEGRVVHDRRASRSLQPIRGSADGGSTSSGRELTAITSVAAEWRGGRREPPLSVLLGTGTGRVIWRRVGVHADDPGELDRPARRAIRWARTRPSRGGRSRFRAARV